MNYIPTRAGAYKPDGTAKFAPSRSKVPTHRTMEKRAGSALVRIEALETVLSKTQIRLEQLS